MNRSSRSPRLATSPFLFSILSVLFRCCHYPWSSCLGLSVPKCTFEATRVRYVDDIVVAVMSSSSHRCAKCGTVYRENATRAQEWQFDRIDSVWYCPVCTRQAVRDGHKEFKSLLTTFGEAAMESPGIWADIKLRRKEEYWLGLKNQPLSGVFTSTVSTAAEDGMDCSQ